MLSRPTDEIANARRKKVEPEPDAEDTAWCKGDQLAIVLPEAALNFVNLHPRFRRQRR